MGDAEEEGLEISKVLFEELKKALPSLTRSVQGEILWEVSLGLSKRVRRVGADSPSLTDQAAQEAPRQNGERQEEWRRGLKGVIWRG